MPDVSFYFDPSCPWTWNTSRWLVDVARDRGFPVRWRTFSLAVHNEGRDIGERARATLEAAKAALRVVEALRRDDRNDDIARFYLDLGRRWHHDHDDRTVDTVRSVLEDVRLSALGPAIDDDALDASLRASIAEALELAGPDVGSPILRIGDHAMFGPIVSPPPVGVDGTKLWDAMALLIPAAGVYEIKRGRSGPVKAGLRP
jgi:hypothetical protein